MVIVERLLPSYLTYAIIFAFNPCVCNTWFTYRAMAAPNVYVVSNKPMVTWQGSQLWLKKWMIKTKMSTIPLDIHKSKFTMQVSQDSKYCTMNFSLVFLVTLGKVSYIRVRLDGNLTWGFYLKINLLRNGNFTKDKGTKTFAINRNRSSSNYFFTRIILGVRSNITKEGSNIRWGRAIPSFVDFRSSSGIFSCSS